MPQVLTDPSAKIRSNIEIVVKCAIIWWKWNADTNL